MIFGKSKFAQKWIVVFGTLDLSETYEWQDYENYHTETKMSWVKWLKKVYIYILNDAIFQSSMNHVFLSAWKNTSSYSNIGYITHE